MNRLAIVSTHPIQYYAPWFKLLSKELDGNMKVFYTWSQSRETVKDKTFGKTIAWDIPLLDGYPYEFVENISSNPGTHHKDGIICPELVEKLKAWKPDAILVFGWYLKSHWDVMKAFKGKTLIWFRGDSTMMDETGSIKKILRKLFLTYVYKKVDKAFYVGTENKLYFLNHGLQEDQLIFAPHAIDNNRFFNSESTNYDQLAEQWRLDLGYQKNDTVILFAGKFESKKQPDFLLKAVQEANKLRKSPLKLLLVGNGPLEEHLNQLSSNDFNVQILPFQNQSKMPLLYRLSNIYCLPSQGPGETWGLAVNEAMASGIPALVSNKVGCSTDLIKHEQNGYIFDCHDFNELVSILVKLENKTLLEFGKQAQLDIVPWNFQNIVEAITKELSKIS